MMYQYFYELVFIFRNQIQYHYFLLSAKFPVLVYTLFILHCYIRHIENLTTLDYLRNAEIHN